ncbi:hypothetical protein B0T17DRAFT_524321 [Bombardia bombarda]|uniref:Uncharacterized protein n=1 Tax=Bombardia bombarda TaxID=252184 RepID=A0AA39X7Z3_9PEZI|nr:hypothetical protein B0T17DRAFT_524321 [Bombardia bombarda]
MRAAWVRLQARYLRRCVFFGGVFFFLRSRLHSMAGKDWPVAYFDISLFHQFYSALCMGLSRRAVHARSGSLA